MKKILVAYADSKMAYSLKHIGRQAGKLNFFDEIKLFTPDDLPEEVKGWELMKYSYGGGYWAWKPYIIWKTLQDNDVDTVVFYIDAGCTLKNGYEWEWLAKLSERYETILFQYKDIMPEWEKFGSTSTKIKYWTKKSAIDFYDSYVGDSSWKENNKIMGGCIIVRNKNNKIINEWVRIVREHPEVIMDPNDEKQLAYFAQHKHDQPLLVALSHKFKDDCLVLPEFQESLGENVPIYASRIRCMTFKDFIIDRSKFHARKVLGNELMSSIKRLIKG